MRLLLLLLVVFTLSARAQAPFECGSDILLNDYRQQPGFLQQEQGMNNSVLQGLNNRGGGGTITIPVVVHVIYENSFGAISDASIIQGIQQLNDDFSGTNIQFCLAQQDTNGNYTTGINRIYSLLTAVDITTEDQQLKDLSRWDPTRYLNIWTVYTIYNPGTSNILAYSTLPASHGSNTDGVVCRSAYFTAVGALRSLVLTHEVGHYLGLYHTFEGSCTNNDCQIDGDRVCDTPPDNNSTENYPCSSITVNTCSTDTVDISSNNPFRSITNGGLGDQPDDIYNHMDYGYPFCHTHFSQGQIDRMYVSTTTIRASLLASQGCISPCPTIPVNVVFTTNNDTTAVGVSTTYTVQNPNGNYQWFINGIPVFTGNSFTYTFNAVGNYTVSVKGTSNNPNCIFLYSMPVFVECRPTAQFIMPSGPYVPGVAYTITNTTQGTSVYRWYLDGILQSTATNFTFQFNDGGGHNIWLIADNNQCSDTSNTAFFSVGDCIDEGMTNNWAFTNRIMNFSSNPPGVVATANIKTQAPPCAVMSDIDGNLLFYTDGDTVWDKNHHAMPNGTGLRGLASSLAVPYPGNVNKYYIFSATGKDLIEEFTVRYSVVDMTLNNGLGDIVSNRKNVILRTSTATERLSATYHTNGSDIWVMLGDINVSKCYAYLITPTGVSDVAVESFFPTTYSIGHYGQLKFSPDGNKVAVAQFVGGVVLADFNKTTGQMMNIVVFKPNNWLGYTSAYPWGVEFSPDNSKVYISLSAQIPTEQNIIQYDLTAGSQTQIIYSGKPVAFSDPASYGYKNIVSGNDGKLYTSYLQRTNNLDYLATPNLAGPACGFVPNVIVGPGFRDLPNLFRGHVQRTRVDIVGPVQICAGGNAYTYWVPTTSGQTVVWSYTGQGLLIANGDSATVISPAVVSTDMLMATIYGQCRTMYDTLQIQTVDSLQTPIFTPVDTIVCAMLTLTPESNFTHYLWSNNDTTPSITINNPGNYWVTVTNACNTIGSDTIKVMNGNPLLFQLTHNGDTMACVSELPFFLPAPDGYQYVWQNGNNLQNNYMSVPGTYWVTIYDGYGCSATDTFRVVDCTGIDEHLANTTHIYPNPASDVLYIESTDRKTKMVNVFNVSGQVVLSTRFTGKASLPISNLPNGVYVAEILGDVTTRSKFLIIR